MFIIRWFVVTEDKPKPAGGSSIWEVIDYVTGHTGPHVMTCRHRVNTNLERQSFYSVVSKAGISLVLFWSCSRSCFVCFYFLMFLNDILYVLSVLPTCICMNHACAWWPQTSEGVRCTRTGVTEVCESPLWVLGINPDPLQEQQAFPHVEAVSPAPL